MRRPPSQCHGFRPAILDRSGCCGNRHSVMYRLQAYLYAVDASFCFFVLYLMHSELNQSILERLFRDGDLI